MIEVFRESGFPIDRRSTRDAIEIELPTSLSPAAIERFEERERTAAVAAVEPVPGAAVGGGDRRVAATRDDRRRDPAQPDRRWVHRRRVSRQPARRRRAGPPGLPLRRRDPRAGGPGRGGRAGRAGRSTWRGSARPRGCGRCWSSRPGSRETGAEGAARQRELLDVCRALGHAADRAQLPGRAEHRAGRQPQRHLRAASGRRRAASAFSPRAAGSGSPSSRPSAGSGVGLSSFVSVGNKADLSSNDSARVLGAGPEHRRRPAVPGVVRQPAQVRARRTAVRARQADPGGQERPLGRRGAGDLVAHRRAAVGLGRDRRRAVSTRPA